MNLPIQLPVLSRSSGLYLLGGGGDYMFIVFLLLVT